MKTMKTKLAVVILNWNGKDFLQRFLPSLIANTPSYAEIIVADNASKDDSVSMMRERFPYIRLIQNAKNGGFSKGYNEALSQIDAEYYCLLNSDVEVAPHWIEPIIDRMDEDAQIGAMQPKLLAYDAPDSFEYAGAAGGFIDKFGYPFCRGRLFGIVEKDEGQYDSEIEIFWASGAALFVRSEIYHQLGGLDEDFFAHMEEIDFCWRLKNNGYKILVSPKSVVYHVGGGTLPKKNSLKTYLNFRNNLFLLLKNLPKNRLVVTFVMRFILDNIAAVTFLLKGNGGDFLAVYKAMIDFSKQRKIMALKRGDDEKRAYSDTYQKSIVFTHYLMRKKHFDGKTLK